MVTKIMLYYFSDRSVETIDDLRIATIYQWEKKFSLSIANREFELLVRIGTRYIVAMWIWLTLIYFHLFLVSLIFIYVLARIIILNYIRFFYNHNFYRYTYQINIKPIEILMKFSAPIKKSILIDSYIEFAVRSSQPATMTIGCEVRQRQCAETHVYCLHAELI